MNDFTKKELEYLYEAAETEVKYFDDSHIGHSLLLKIQTMIDNYCEHENIVTGAYPRSNPPKKCEACGVLHYDNQ